MGQAPSGVCGPAACSLDARRQTVNGAHRPCPESSCRETAVERMASCAAREARSLQQNEKPRHDAGARIATAYIRP